MKMKSEERFPYVTPKLEEYELLNDQLIRGDSVEEPGEPPDPGDPFENGGLFG